MNLRRFVLGVALLVGLLFFQLTLPVQAQRGGLVVPRNLLELVEESETIVVGRVVSARTEPHPQFKNLDTVVVTLRVEETWKGSPDSTFSFRQYVWDFRDAQDSLGYKTGQEVLLMMIRPSGYGLSSPAGLQQGRFRLQRGQRGQRLVMNGFGNRGLFTRMDEQLRQERIELSPSAARLVETHRQGPIHLGRLSALVRQLVRDE